MVRWVPYTRLTLFYVDLYMITEQFIWFIDSRFYYQTTSLDKIVHLIPPHQKSIKIIIDASAQLKGRGYWHLFNDKQLLSDELMQKIETKKEQLIKFFTMNAMDVEITINSSADYLKVLNAEVNNNQNCVVVIEDNVVDKRHSIFQRLTDINAPVLLLNKQAWKHPLSVIGAVDPLHEHARITTIDEHITTLSESWAKQLKASWLVAHCYHVTSVLVKYKSKILSMHRDGLADFAKRHRIPAGKTILLEGVPEVALTSYIKKNSSNILVMGLVTRNKLEQFWIGSTTTVLLTELPCDILLVKK